MEKYIIAVDMDGTLLNSENKISERNRNVLQRLIDDGHYVVPATGRTRELIPQEFSVLRGVKWGIVENAAGMGQAGGLFKIAGKSTERVAMHDKAV